MRGVRGMREAMGAWRRGRTWSRPPDAFQNGKAERTCASARRMSNAACAPGHPCDVPRQARASWGVARGLW